MKMNLASVERIKMPPLPKFQLATSVDCNSLSKLLTVYIGRSTEAKEDHMS